MQISFKIEQADLEAEMDRWLILLQEQDPTITDANEFSKRMLTDNLVARVLEREGQIARTNRNNELRAKVVPEQPI